MNYQELLENTNPHILLKVKDYGTIQLELFPKVAPITVKNFLKLVESGFYTGLTFHRIIAGFMIQGGDPLGNGTGGSKEKIKGEFAQNGIDNPLKHTRGVISMARSMFPDSASSQFFIMHKDAPHLDGAYAAFGAVIEGIEVVDKIAGVDVNYNDMPLHPVVIEKAEVI
ncbi:MAG: peptidylprolyl isomerase [Anaeroplasmataceae bacterium]|nr:peptidylprolyl isomerase [Anaeroplasmataceae bacterium]MDE6413815.1 peptidylprolyl isomerase [Anaeroplasmataceae bacterium]